MTMKQYSTFIAEKAQLSGNHGFGPEFVPSALFDFQAALVDWAMWKGRAAIFADCGLGKTAMQLTWAENIVRSEPEVERRFEMKKDFTFCRRLWLFVRIVWRIDQTGFRMSRTTAWDVSKIVWPGEQEETQP